MATQIRNARQLIIAIYHYCLVNFSFSLPEVFWGNDPVGGKKKKLLQEVFIN